MTSTSTCSSSTSKKSSLTPDLSAAWACGAAESASRLAIGSSRDFRRGSVLRFTSTLLGRFAIHAAYARVRRLYVRKRTLERYFLADKVSLKSDAVVESIACNARQIFQFPRTARPICPRMAIGTKEVTFRTTFGRSPEARRLRGAFHEEGDIIRGWPRIAPLSATPGCLSPRRS